MLQISRPALLIALGIGIVCISLPSCQGFVIPTKSLTRNVATTTTSPCRNQSPSFSSSLCELHSTKATTDSEIISSPPSSFSSPNGENAVTTAAKTTTEQFKNDGLFSWMQPYLDLFGFVEGNTVYYGPGVAVDPTKVPSKEEQERLRQEAMENMMNIGVDERERRREAGKIATMVAIGYALLSSIVLDDGTLEGHFVRLGVALVSGRVGGKILWHSVFFSSYYV